MAIQFSFDPFFLVVSLVIPLGFIIVVWLAFRKYFETHNVGFLFIALAFMLYQVPLPTLLFSHLFFGRFWFMVISWISAGKYILFFVLLAYGLLKLFSNPQKNVESPSVEKLNLIRQLSLLAGITVIVATFHPWITYGYSYSTPTGGGSGIRPVFLFDAFLLPSVLAQVVLEQIDVNTLIIAATLAGILFLVAGVGCIVKDEKWSVLSVAGLIAFFFAYVVSPGASLLIAMGGRSTSNGATVWQMALSPGFILGTLGVAIGLAALIISIAEARAARITHMGEKPTVQSDGALISNVRTLHELAFQIATYDVDKIIRRVSTRTKSQNLNVSLEC